MNDFDLFAATMSTVGGAIDCLPNENGTQNDLITNAAFREIVGQAYNADWNLEDVVRAVQHHYRSIMRNIRISGGEVPYDYETTKERPIIDCGRQMNR